MRAPGRLLVAGLIDWTGTGFYLAISAIFLTRTVGLSTGAVGLALAGVGLIAFVGSVPIGRLGDRLGHREVLIVLHAVRGAAFLAMASTPSVGVAVAALALIGVGDQAAASLTQAFAGELVGPSGRVALMARLRTVTNVGLTLGTIPAGLVLASGATTFAPLLVANAGSYVIAAVLLATLPRPRRLAAAGEPRGFLIPSAPTTALIAIDGLMAMWQTVLNIGVPLWVLQATAASPAVIAVLYATNTVLVVLLQTAMSRHVGSYRRAAHAQRLAGLLLATACLCLAVCALPGRTVSTLLLVTAIVCLTLAELLKTSAAWQITFALAPSGRAGEFFATYGLGRVACSMLGPILITAVVLVLGELGWLLLAVLLVVGGLATPPIARRALQRPIARPPRSRAHTPPTLMRHPHPVTRLA